MKIAQIAPCWKKTPPVDGYGGVEWVVSFLTEELVRQGHEVTLFATGDSRTGAHLEFAFDSPPMGFEACDEIHHVGKACATIARGGFDVVHNHTHGLAAVLLCAADVPCVTTLHIPFAPGGAPSPHRALHGAISSCHRYVAISRRQRSLAPELNWVGTVHNGLDPGMFPFSEEKSDYLLFMGRIHPVKMPHLAIAAARAAGLPIKLAGPLSPGVESYWTRDVAPLVDGRQVDYVGEVGFARKAELYRHARALLMPLDVAEPFGMVVIEALACGTPVIAFRRGAIPEILTEGKVGFVVGDLGEMTAAIGRLGEISPRACRAHVEKHFTAELMARRYLEVYRGMA